MTAEMPTTAGDGRRARVADVERSADHGARWGSRYLAPFEIVGPTADRHLHATRVVHRRTVPSASGLPVSSPSASAIWELDVRCRRSDRQGQVSPLEAVSGP